MKSLLKFLLNPWIIFFSAVCGSLVGVFIPDFAETLAPLGSIYLKLLQMLVLPILITAIISGLGRLFISGTAQNYIVRLLLFIVANLMVASSVGVMVGLLSHVGGELSDDALAILGRTISKVEIDPQWSMHKIPEESFGLLGFVRSMIPNNIFQALASGNNLAVLFFSILVGISMGLLRSGAERAALNVVDAFYSAFLEAINRIMYLLPLGLFCLFASQIAQVGPDVFIAMSKLVIFVYLSSILLILIFSMVIWLRSEHSYWETLVAFRQTFFIAFGTASGFATIPSALSALQNKLSVDRNVSDLILPLGVTINPPGSILYFAMTGMFIAQIYGVHLEADELFIAMVGSILAGISSASAPGIVGLSMISILLTPLGLPVEVAVILLMAIDPIVDPILTVVNVYSNCAMTLVAGESRRYSVLETEQQGTA